jgi:predicted lipid-binding transport protein (Tim44 family)
MADEHARPENPAADGTGLRGFLATRRGRRAGFGALGVLLLAVAGALVWGLTVDTPEQVAAATTPAPSTSAAPTPAAPTSTATTSGTAPTTSAAPTTAVSTTAGEPSSTPEATSSSAAPSAATTTAAAEPGPWCTSDCTATSAQRAMELAIMAVQANDMDAFRQVTIDMDVNDLRSAMSHGAPDVRPCQEDDGDATCVVVFGTAVFDYNAQTLPYDPSEGPRDMPWAVTYVGAH